MQPKGDLTVLLGDIPSYDDPGVAQPSIPVLPIEHAHPYHIVVVAAQECPTPSNLPRGIGGGLAKGLGVKSPHKREKDLMDGAASYLDPGDDGEKRSGSDLLDQGSTRTAVKHALAPKGWSTRIEGVLGLIPGSKRWLIGIRVVVRL